jgi:hypothetical protein
VVAAATPASVGELSGTVTVAAEANAFTTKKQIVAAKSLFMIGFLVR